MKTLTLTTEELARIAHRKQTAKRLSADAEWVAIAEFGKHYGWNAVMAVLNDEITSDQMSMLLDGARKVESLTLYNESMATFIAVSSANSKKPAQSFKRMTREFLNKAKPNG